MIQKISLPNNAVVYLQPAKIANTTEKAVGAFPGVPKLQDLGKTIAGIAQAVRDGLADVAVQSVSLDFGLELAVEGGHLTSLFAKTSATADVHVTLEIDVHKSDRT